MGFQPGGTGGEPADSALPLANALPSRAAPPCFISFLNLERLFWNQILTCKSGQHSDWGPFRPKRSLGKIGTVGPLNRTSHHFTPKSRP